MSLSTVIEYHHLFDEPRPNPIDLLKNIPSRFVIGMMALINDILSFEKDPLATQAYLLNNLTINFPQDIRHSILSKAGPLLEASYILFEVPFTIEFINKELINFRNDDVKLEDNNQVEELNIFKAYVAIMDEMIQSDIERQNDVINNAIKYGDDYLLRLVWPMLIKQHEFHNSPDAILERYKGRAFMSYLESHETFGNYVKDYYKKLDCKSGQQYLSGIETLIVDNLKRKQGDPPKKFSDHFTRISSGTAEPILESLVIDPDEIKNDNSKQIDYRGQKEKPLFKFDDAKNEYIVPHWDYLYNSVFNGLVFSFYRNSDVQKSITRFDDYKAIIGREFTEEILFKGLIKKCFNNNDDALNFFEDDAIFNPDCYYRQGKHIFIIEFKDYLLATEVIQSNSYDKIKKALDNKFVGDASKGKKGKGVNQLAWNIEYLINTEGFFYQLDKKAEDQGLKLEEMIISPVIVQTNIYFDFPYFNEYLNSILEERFKDIRQKVEEISSFTMINFNYFFHRVLLFADGKLQFTKELEFYHQKMRELKKHALQTRDENDWIQSIAPFSLFNSPQYRENFHYRRKDLLQAIDECWKIDKSSEL
jgi:hypothetical protein